MTQEIIILFLGFILTTVFGGFLGHYLQRRGAELQWLRTRKEKELEVARNVFEEVSRLCDKRLYRAKQLLWNLDASEEIRSSRLADYRAIIYDWNDNINRLLALLEISFDEDIRKNFDNAVGKKFVQLGLKLEAGFRRENIDEHEISLDIDQLRMTIYQFNLDLLNKLKNKNQNIYKN